MYGYELRCHHRRVVYIYPGFVTKLKAAAICGEDKSQTGSKTDKKQSFYSPLARGPQKTTEAKRNLRSLSLASNAFSHKVDDYFPPVVYRVEKRHNHPWGLKTQSG